MTIRECYEAVGSNYDEVLGRLGSERLVSKFAAKFLDDKTFQELQKALQENDNPSAFRAAHTLKGICLNLGFAKLGEASSELTEMLRNGGTVTDLMYVERVKEEYQRVIQVLQQLDK